MQLSIEWMKEQCEYFYPLYRGQGGGGGGGHNRVEPMEKGDLTILSCTLVWPFDLTKYTHTHTHNGK